MITSKVYGWRSEEEVAIEIYGSPFRDLLSGNLVFAYLNKGATGTIRYAVVSRVGPSFRYCVLSYSGGWSCYCHESGKDGLLEYILENFKQNKTDKKVIEDFIENVNLYDT